MHPPFSSALPWGTVRSPPRAKPSPPPRACPCRVVSQEIGLGEGQWWVLERQGRGSCQIPVLGWHGLGSGALLTAPGQSHLVRCPRQAHLLAILGTGQMLLLCGQCQE